MNERTVVQRQKPTIRAFTSVRTGLLQRKCACGGTPGVDRECAECREKRLSVQRRANNPTKSTLGVPPIVHDVLGSPGQQLDPSTRSFMGPRFGHDFSNVRVYTDTKAAESARAVNALAYTVGRNVVFGVGQYAPETSTGKKLLAHELAHVVQQSSKTTSVQRRLSSDLHEDKYEMEADRTAAIIASGANTYHAFMRTAPTIQRMPVDKNDEFGQSPTTLSHMKIGPEEPLPYREATELQDCMRIHNDQQLCARLVGIDSGLPGVQPLSWSADWPLWFFCGEHPQGFTTTVTLSASITGEGPITWDIITGGDKVAFTGRGATPRSATGMQVRLRSTEGSNRANDVAIRVSEGSGATSKTYTGRMSVLKPHRLISSRFGVIGPRDRPWGSGFISFISYRMVDNLGGSIKGGTVNEQFETGTNLVANNWPVPNQIAGTDVDRDGVFTDRIGVTGASARTPAPQNPGPSRVPPSSLSGQRVDVIRQEFFIGSLTAGRGCSVQRHDFVRFIDHGRHENIVSPAP